MATTSSTALSRLRTSALVVLACVLIQAALGIASLTGYHQVNEIHGWIGYLGFLAGIAAAFFGFQASKADANLKGLFFHALSLPVLAIIQIGIIEASQGAGPMKWVHVVLGFAYLVAAAALYTLSAKRGSARRDLVS